jgi:hypothetical protein
LQLTPLTPIRRINLLAAKTSRRRGDRGLATTMTTDDQIINEILELRNAG